uniref:Uncharacterized protein n=1 Tax=Anguilla anguilla TaxID=7936 RepID=A0A0E9Y051_ANGAN
MSRNYKLCLVSTDECTIW